METSGQEVETAEWAARLVAEVIDYLAWGLAFIPLAVGLSVGLVGGGTTGAAVFFIGLAITVAAVVWVASKYQNGQSVGKRVVGTQVISARDGKPLSWAYNFLVRGVLVKGLAVGVASEITLGIFTLVNYLWPLWDGNRQALHDKMVGTYVVRLPRTDASDIMPRPIE